MVENGLFTKNVGILDYSYITNAGLEAKQLLLDKVKDNLTSARTDSLRKTSDAFHSIVDTYKLQHEIGSF